MSRKHEVSEDLHARTLASHYGFRSLKAFEQEPDNQTLIAQRSTLDDLKPGDMLTVPEGQVGARELGTGRVHEVRLAAGVRVFELRLYTEFRIASPRAPGDKAETAIRWKAFGRRGIYQLEATVNVAPAGGGTGARPETRTNARTGKLEMTGLGDGQWIVHIEPTPEETSSGPARGEPEGDHGLGSGVDPTNGTYQVEYRPLVLSVTVEQGGITHAEIATPPAPNRPHHAALFWLNVEESTNRQVLEVDWKPDFLRRARQGSEGVTVRPKQKHRSPRWEDIDDSEKLVLVHHTAVTMIGGALNTFTPTGTSSGSQFVLDTDGHVVRMADDRYWTKHGGGGRSGRPPSWDNATNPTVNDRALGIETCHAGKVDQLFGSGSFEQEDLPFAEAQYQALIDLIGNLQDTYGITPRRVIGHQDATLKGGCPSPFFEWERLEAAGVALAPDTLTEAELDEMFGGFFAGPGGRDRKLHIEATERETESGWVVDQPDPDPPIEGLTAAPIEELRAALVAIGYGAKVPSYGFGVWVKTDDGTKRKAVVHEFDWVLGFCLSQFVRRYCTGSRLRPDMPMRQAYRDSPRISSRLFLDFGLALLVRGAASAARRIREQEAGA